MGSQNTLPTGFESLNRELPHRGWPLSTLIEFSLSQTGIGEMRLLRPALAQLATERRIALVHPPCSPYFHCWSNWQLETHRLLWINAQTPGDSAWASEQILRHNACSALLYWAPDIRPETMRRLQLAAQKSDALFILLRPDAATHRASAAPLRLSLKPAPQGIEISILKRRGPHCSHSILIPLYSTRPYAHITQPSAPLDQPAPALSQPRRAFSSMGS